MAAGRKSGLTAALALLSDTLKHLYPEAGRMFPILEAGVQPGVINAAGLLVGLGGVALTIGWLSYLYR